MAFPPETQSLPICALLAGLGGIFEVFATAIVAYPDAQQQREPPPKTQWSDRAIRLTLVGNILLQIVASVLGNTMSTWFGPVSIAGPIFFAAQMVANMVVFGTLLGLESFTKEMRVGTWVVVVGTLLLCVNGPQVQDDQDVNDLILNWYSLVWSGVLLLGMAGSSLVLARGIGRLKSEFSRCLVLLIARGCALSVNLTVSKPFALKPGIPMVFVWVAFKIVSGAVYTLAIMIQSTAVTQSVFVPMNTSCTLLLNAITGIIIWEDWRSVVSWLGYVSSFMLLVLGTYLLLGDSDFQMFMSDNPRYGHRGKLVRVKGQKDFSEYVSSRIGFEVGDDHDGDNDHDDDDHDDGDSDTKKTKKEESSLVIEQEQPLTQINEDKDEDDDDVETPTSSPTAATKTVTNPNGTHTSHRNRFHRPGLLRSSSTSQASKEGWRRAFGVTEHFISDRGGLRQQSIFFKDLLKDKDEERR